MEVKMHTVGLWFCLVCFHGEREELLQFCPARFHGEREVLLLSQKQEIFLAAKYL